MPQGKAGAARERRGWRSHSYARKITDPLAFLIPCLLLAGLALAGGGYDLFARHVAGILSWLLVAALLIGTWPDRIRPGISLGLIGGLILSLAVFSAISSIWADSVSASLTEFERGISYLGFFLASYLSLRTPKQREWFARGIGVGLAAIVLLALGDRLIPGGSTGDDFGIARLSYPLGYWNADGVCFAAALVLFIWFAADAVNWRLRSTSMAVAVLAGTSLYLTYSRGGLVVATLAMVLLLFLTPRRLRVFVALLTAVAGATPLLLAISAYPAISGDQMIDPTTAQSLVILMVALASTAFAAATFEAMVRLAGRGDQFTLKMLRISKDRRFLATVAGVGVAALLALSLAFGSNVWDQFTDSDVPTPTDGRSRFTELSGFYRYEFNQVALETFADNPIIGSSAGSYPAEWNRRREVPVVTNDAHSFYLENLAELGLIGGLLSLGLVLSVAVLGFLTVRKRLGPEGPVVLALAVALFASLALDWFWKLSATAALLMLLAAWIASAETVDPDRSEKQAGRGFRLAGLIGSWLAIVILAVPAIADRYEVAAADSVRAGEISRAKDQAENASRLEPWAAEPHLQLGRIAESRGQFAEALSEYDRAIDLDPTDWQAVLLRFNLNLNAERLNAARSDYDLLRRINPVYFGQFTFRQIRRITP